MFYVGVIFGLYIRSPREVTGKRKKKEKKKKKVLRLLSVINMYTYIYK